MQEKKIITWNNVKENNPNDDEEILKNLDSDPLSNYENNEEGKSEKKQYKPDGSETLGIP